MGWTANNIMVGGGPGNIMEVGSDVQKTGGEVVSGIKGETQMECRCCDKWGGRLIKVYALHLRSTISTMEIEIAVDVICYIIGGQGKDASDNLGSTC